MILIVYRTIYFSIGLWIYMVDRQFFNLKKKGGFYYDVFVYGTIYSNIKQLLWLCLYIKLYILHFKENMLCQVSNEEFKYKIECKFNLNIYIGTAQKRKRVTCPSWNCPISTMPAVGA